MYYHSRELKYVKYGKIYPAWTPCNWLDLNYKWLSQFCGYAPQVWLSKANIHDTGFQNQKNKYNKDDILFGFDIIKGFPVSMESWEYTLNAFSVLYHYDDDNDVNIKDKYTVQELNKRIEEYLFEEYDEEYLEPYMHNVEALYKVLFKEVDQVVVPSLNLKSAKKIICRTDLQKKKLRKMGFIEDRIMIKKLPRDI